MIGLPAALVVDVSPIRRPWDIRGMEPGALPQVAVD